MESKYIVTNSGSEVVERARELAVHFQTTGTPVMIGEFKEAKMSAANTFFENLLRVLLCSQNVKNKE